MGRTEMKRFLPMLAVACCVAMPALAQDATAAHQDALKVETQESEHLSDKDKMSRSDDEISEMQKVLRDVLDRLEEARKDRDIVKLNCVNEKLTQIKALLRIAEQSYIALQEAVARAAEDNAEHEFAKIQIAKQRVTELRAEAEQCIGELAYVVDEKTVVTVETPEGLPDATTNPPVAQPVVVGPPVINNPPPLSPTN